MEPDGFERNELNGSQPQRKPTRARFHNYSGGLYFITICTREKKHYFGEIEIDRMRFTSVGRYANEMLADIESHLEYAEVPLYVVMPNHIHLILAIDEDKLPSQARSAVSIVIGSFKRAVTVFARKNDIAFDWQRGFHDRIIRDHREGRYITDYIENNPARWGSDCFYDIKVR